MSDVDTRIADPPRPRNTGQTQTDPDNHDNTVTDPNVPMAVEWGMRADCAIDYGGGIIGRLVHEPMAVSDGDGEPRRVYLFVDKMKASPDDHLDDSDDSSSNHKRLPKKVAKKPIHGWVRVPKPSPPSSDPHHDYSYHGGPPHKGSKRGSSSSGGSGSPTGGAPVPRGGGGSDRRGQPQPGGPELPPAPGTDGEQVRTDSMGRTWRRHVTPGGLPTPWEMDEPAPAAGTSSQADQGHIQAQSPEFSQRTNSHRYDRERDVVGVINSEKPKGFTTIRVTVNYKTSAEMLPGQWIVLDLVLSARDTNGLPPSADSFYSSAIAIGNDVAGRDRAWQETTFTFTGFPTQRQFLGLYVCRRAMDGNPLGGDFGTYVPATQNLYVCSTILNWEGESKAAATPLGGYGYGYGKLYGVQL